MNDVKLNLARKWRSKQFDEIIGQDLSIRILKNSLYLQQYFPVYLFSGQRGCGKTTTARVFAASLNCEQLPLFQKNPQQHPIPCLQCVSCKAMEVAKHPDFIEIDAASHTGVDNIRMLIDSAALLPLMGRKKIYLIDEAHMLSKAAFNALLKILEEPPTSVLFILATTDPQKIIETVQSRCFQLLFRPVDTQVLQEHLHDICVQENIAFDAAGLALIIKQTDGSVRDALNLLEQVRFSTKEITYTAVREVLGFIDDAALITLLDRVLAASRKEVLQHIGTLRWYHFSAAMIWTRLLELLRAALWIKYEVMPSDYKEYHATLKAMVAAYPVQQLIACLQIMYEQELLFHKTTAKHDFIEMILLQMCHRNNRSNSDGGTSSSSNLAPAVDAIGTADQTDDSDDEQQDDEVPQDSDEEETISVLWKRFVDKVIALNDPLLHSIFSQGMIKQWDELQRQVHVEFSKEFNFFNDLLVQTQRDWQPLIQEIFGAQATVIPAFTGASRAISKKPVEVSVVKPIAKPIIKAPGTKLQPLTPYKKPPMGAKNYSDKLFAKDIAIDVSDTTKWQKTDLIMRYLPGTVTEIRE